MNSVGEGSTRNRKSAMSNVSLPATCLMAISVTETVLISRTAATLRIADIASREMRSGELTAHKNVTVSGMSRTHQ